MVSLRFNSSPEKCYIRPSCPLTLALQFTHLKRIQIITMKNGYSKSNAKPSHLQSIKQLHIKISNGYVHVYSYTENEVIQDDFFLYKAPFSKESYLTLRSNVQNTRGGDLGFSLDCNTSLKVDCNI